MALLLPVFNYDPFPMRYFEDDLLDSLLSPLALLDATLRGNQVRKAATKRRQPAKWVEWLDLPGLAADQLSAEMKEGRVVITGRREEGDEENRCCYEVRRTVKLPAGVDVSKLTCKYLRDRYVVLEAPVLAEKTEQQPSSEATTKATSSADMPTPAAASTDRQSEETHEKLPEDHQEKAEPPTPPATPDTASHAAPELPAAETESSHTAADDARPAGEEEGCLGDTEDASEDGEPALADSFLHKLFYSDDDVSEENPGNAETSENVAPMSEPAPSSEEPRQRMTATVKPCPPVNFTDATPPVKRPTPLKMAVSNPVSSSTFDLSLDVQGFKPEQLTATLTGRTLVVKGERRVEENGVCTMESFYREITLPRTVDTEGIKCHFSDDGRLQVSAPNNVLPSPEVISLPVYAA